MIPERDYVIAKAEVQARREAADAERMVREARREAAARDASARGEGPCPDEGRERGAFGWLRRLAGAR